MRSSRKSLMLALAAALGATHAVAQKPGDKKSEGKKGEAKANAEEVLDLPIPKGQPQRGVKVPLYGANGKLKMNFEIGIGTWVDEENIKLEKLRVETFREDGDRELDMDLPDAVYNTRTKVISSQTKVFIKRSDFEITGNTMAFNIESREGTLGGGVKMLIYNIQDMTDGKDKQPTVEFAPTPGATPAEPVKSPEKAPTQPPQKPANQTDNQKKSKK